MDNRIVSQIHKLSAYTDTTFKSIQRVYIPSVYNLHIERMYKTHYDLVEMGFLRSSLTFVSNNIPIVYHRRNETFLGTLDHLVSEGYLKPFLLFYQGKFVKWSDIAIKVTRRYNYLYIRNIDVLNYNNHDDIQCILLPINGIYYRENLELSYIRGAEFSANETPLFVFDDNGMLVSGVPDSESTRYTIVSSIKNRVDFGIEQFKGKPNTPYNSDIIPENKYLSEDNIIYFKDSLLVHRAIDKKEFRKVSHNGFQLASKGGIFDIKIFFYNHGNDSKNIMSGINNPNITTYSYDKDFDFEFDQNKSYEQNLTDILQYCMSYNSAFMNDIYLDMSNIKYRTYSGKHIRGLIDENHKVRMSTRVDAENYNKVIIYHNGLLYSRYSSIVYINKDYQFYIDPDNIKDDDVFEIIYFKKSYNLEKDITLMSKHDDQYYIGEDVDLADFTLFSTNLYKDHKYFNTEVSELAQYAIPFKYKLLEKNIYEIIPNHPYYYDKKCTLVSNRQFKYFYKKISEEVTFDFELSKDFKFCIDPNKYLVHVNGRRISFNNFKITIVKNTRPFAYHSIYFNIPLKRGDVIEVFYVPDTLREVHFEKELDITSGAIVVDKDKLTYNLDKDLYLFYINGKKVLSNDIQNINKNIVKIKVSEDIHNVSIVKHINSIDVLARLFKYTDDIMDKLIKDIDELELSDELNKLYGSSNINNTNIAYDFDKISMKKILYKLIRDHWNKPYINKGTEFIYDYDSEELDIGPDGTILIPSMNGNEYNF